MPTTAAVDGPAIVALVVLMTAFTNLLTAAIILFAAMAFRSAVPLNKKD